MCLYMVLKALGGLLFCLFCFFLICGFRLEWGPLGPRAQWLFSGKCFHRGICERPCYTSQVMVVFHIHTDN